MIELYNVTKKYKKSTAIDNLSISLLDNGIYCLLGRNGAGKTTLMKLICASIAPNSGSVAVNGETVGTLKMPENVRYIEAAKKQFNMKICELFDLAHGIDPKFDIDFAYEMSKRFKLNEKKKYNSLSFGMKTMVTTIISLASNADVILLDEPVLGFDAIMRKEFYKLLELSYENNPRIIIVSTHLIDEIANTASKIIIIDKGKLVLYENIESALEKSYKITGPKENVDAAAKNLNVLYREEIGKFSLVSVYGDRPADSSGIEISNMSLEELFIGLVGGKENE